MDVAYYLLPGHNHQKGDAALEYINNVIVQVKRKYTGPFIVAAGDYNQWRIEEALADFPDTGTKL